MSRDRRGDGIQEVVSSILIGSTNNEIILKTAAERPPLVLPPYYDDAVSGTIVYLDICALKRSFDDARSERIRREAEAVARIFEKVENGSIQLVASPAHRFENDRNPREDRRLATALWLQKAGRVVDATPNSDDRARQLAGMGFGPLDALHLAFAEKARARWFVTTDDQLLRRAREWRDHMQVDVIAPDQLTIAEERQE